MPATRIALLSWLLSISFSALYLGKFLGHRIEGRIATSSELGVAAMVLVSMGISIVFTVRAAAASSNDADGQLKSPSGRRRFLTAALGTTGGIAASLAAAIIPNRKWGSVTAKNIFLVRPEYKSDVSRDEWAGARVEGYRRLGRTNAFVSDISLGSGSSTGGRQTVDVTREAIDRGINYFDTAPDYSESGSEKRFGEAMKGQRDKMFVATKFCFPNGHIAPGSSVEDYMQAVEGSLTRLQTDWVDLVHIHSCDSVDRLMDPNVHEAFDRLKEQGKVRFLGVSTHTPNLEAVASAAVESDRFDVMMLAYHFGAWPSLENIIDRAAAKDIGIVGMKTLRGSMHHFLNWSPDERDSFTQASFKWVLSNPSVSCLVISLWETGQLDEFLYASGESLRPQDVAVLDRYSELTTDNYCRPHCGACLESCEKQLPIHDVLRQRMYFENFGAQKEGMRLYGELAKNASVCAGCAAPCAGTCPSGLDIQARMSGAHKLLSLS